MSDIMRILLFFASIATGGWILYKIRRFQVKMQDAIFWVVFAVILFILGVFPRSLLLAYREAGDHFTGKFCISCGDFSFAGKSIYAFHYRVSVRRKNLGSFCGNCSSHQ